MLSLVLFGLLVAGCTAVSPADVVYAVNAGGREVVGANGVKYAADTEPSKATPAGTKTAEMYNMQVNGALPQEYDLFLTERYGFSTFGYNLPKLGPGKYTLVLRFAEVYFREAGQKMFDVSLGGLQVATDIDIFEKVGFSAALTEFIEFDISSDGKSLTANGETAAIATPFRLEFLKGRADNPKICAFVIVKGGRNDVESFFPIAPPPVEPPKEEERIEKEEDPQTLDEIERHRRELRQSKRKENPYESSSDLTMYIVIGVVAVAGIFIALNSSKTKKA